MTFSASLKVQSLQGYWQVLPPSQGVVSRGVFHFWAETEARRVQAVQPFGAKGPAPYPFSAGHAVLPDLFPGSPAQLKGAAFEKLNLRIAGGGKMTGWQVDTLALEISDTLDFLTDPVLSVKNSAEPMACLAEAAQWALSLIERGSFTPDLRSVEREGVLSFTAFWRLRFSTEEETRLESFGRSLPDVLRLNLPEGLKGSAYVKHFMETCADAWIRKQGGLAGEMFFASVPEQWLKSLSEPLVKERGARLITGPKTELEAFEKDLQKWLGFETGKSFRACFKLCEPETQEGPWLLEFALQSLDDPSKVISAASVWGRDPQALSTLAASGLSRPDEFLLAALARAAILFPPVASALGVRAPYRAVLSGRDAYLFLTQQALLFKAKGFGVLVPAWWHQKKKRFSLRLRLKPLDNISHRSPGPVFSSSGLSGLQGLLEYDWDVLAGEHVLTLDELEPLVRLKTPFLKISGAWVEMRIQELENLTRYFDSRDKNSEKTMSIGDALRLALEGETTETGLPVNGIAGEGWVEGWLRQLSEGIEFSKADVPESFQGQLRPYQHRGLSWLAFLVKWGFGACLADDMGLGKTVQVIALMLHLREKENTASFGLPFLLVCPMSIVGNWQREISRFAPSLKVMIHHGGERQAGSDFQTEAAKADVVITTYSLIYRDQVTLASQEWGLVILDEAQNIKNEAALQTRAVKTLKARARIALTGTPVENRVTELWSIMDFLNPGYLGNFESFRLAFQAPIEKRLDTRRLDALKRKAAPFVLRRLKSDKTIIQDLPEKMEMKVYCNLTREQASLYKIVAEEMMAKIRETSGIQRKGLVFSAITKLKQVCNHPAHYEGDGSLLADRSGKLNRLVEMIEEILDDGGRALVFTQYVEMGHLLAKALKEGFKRETLFLHGGLSMTERDALVQDFQKNSQSPPVLILSVKAGGSGLNLTAANHVFHYDRWWNPAVEDQATDRAYRIGQTRAVQVHKFLCAGTLEEKIDLMIERKRMIADAVITSGEEFLTEISDDELRDVLKLEADAEAE